MRNDLDVSLSNVSESSMPDSPTSSSAVPKKGCCLSLPVVVLIIVLSMLAVGTVAVGLPLIIVFSVEASSNVDSGPDSPTQPTIPTFTPKMDIDTRNYEVFVPPTLTENSAVPLLFALHGLTGSMSTMRFKSKFDDVATKYGFIVVYPEGSSWDGGSSCCRWNDHNQPERAHVNDVDFLDALWWNMSHPDHDFGIPGVHVDLNRRFQVGHSNGGFMTYTYAANGSRVISIQAIAPVSASISRAQNELPFPTTRKLSVFHVHGDDDGIVPIVGCAFIVFCPYNINQTLSAWLAQDECTQIDASTAVRTRHETDLGGKVQLKTYSTCPDGLTVSSLVLNAGPHDWASLNAYVTTEPKTGFAVGAESLGELIWKGLIGTL